MKPSILVIEDEIGIREGIVEILEYEAMRVAAAADGDSGIQLAREFIPDLIICDISMPGKSGYDVLLELQGDPATANIPFIFLTALADRSALRYGMELGADDYLTKPFVAEELITAVNTRLQKKARLVQEYSAQADELRQTLLLTLPHELRTPLVGIIGGAEMLLMDQDMLDADHIMRMADMILRSGKRLHRLIENYLLLAQLEIFHYDPERLEGLRGAMTNTPGLIIRDVARVKAGLVERDVDLNLRLQDGVVRIADENLKKIVEELVDNAFKFSSPGSAVTVAAESQNDTFTLTVTDHGRGMTGEQIKKVGAFVQFGRELYEQQGSGLGLMIVRRLVELHDGELVIESQPEQGTTVRVHLPA